MKKILIVEDDKAISDLIKMNLEMVGYETEQSSDGKDALQKIQAKNFALILLDVMIPSLDGFSLIKEIDTKNTPVIFLTAKKQLSDRVQGLRLGADDYIIKPFESIELIARVEAVLRRYGKKENSYEFENLQIHFDKRTVKKDGEEIELTPKEFQLLELLLKNRGIALSRDKILEKVWGYEYVGETRTVDMHIQKLRKKLSLESKIKTVYKLGYRFEE